jgi:formiminoglutamase
MKIIVYSRNDIQGRLRMRPDETKLGEKVQVAHDSDNFSESLKRSSARYVLLGLPEDIGVRANGGRGGAYSAWQPALSTILNLQSNPLLSGEEIFVLGHVDFSEEMETVRDFDFHNTHHLHEARQLVKRMDDFVFPLIKTIVAAGKEVIVIGGGHNNSYPVLRGVSEGLLQIEKISTNGIHAVNLDAHSDLRPLEGRHSGNGFSYAINEGFLTRYAVIGLQEIFNPSFVFEKLKKHADKIRVYPFDDMYIRQQFSFDEALRHAAAFLESNYTGLEIDMDTIQNIPSSAKTSCGISTIEARRFVYYLASRLPTPYLHIAEAAPVLSHIKTDLKTGKLIAYLVTDFIKARNQFYLS